jgi:hypothetical protein
MVCHKPHLESSVFAYRGITATRSSDNSQPLRWIAEIRRERGYEFVRADSMAEMRQRIDASLARRAAD